MTNPLRIIRRTAAGAAGPPSSLRSGQLAYNENDSKLYYGLGDDGSGNATSIVVVGGNVSYGMELVAGSGAVASSASKVFTGLSVYRELFAMYRMAVATDNTDPGIQFSINGGGSYLAGATEYNQFRAVTLAASVTPGSSSTTTIFLDGFQGVGNLATEGIQGFIHIYEFNVASVIKRFLGSSFFRMASGAGCRADIGGDTTNTTLCDALRFINSGGNISGEINLWGMRG